jgi:hypothetical protein
LQIAQPDRDTAAQPPRGHARRCHALGNSAVGNGDFSAVACALYLCRWRFLRQTVRGVTRDRDQSQ